jgi:DnaJ family protein C protein 22
VLENDFGNFYPFVGCGKFWKRYVSFDSLRCTLIIHPYFAGVYVVANIGREYVSLKLPLVASYCFLPFFWANMSSYITTMAIASTVAVNWAGKTWREVPYPKRTFRKRFAVLGFCGLIYLSMWSSLLYNNVQVTSADGEKIKLRDAVQNFFKSPAWAETKETFHQMYDYYQFHGFEKMWDEFMKALDPEGEANAYKVGIVG